ncbi:MAG TPA: hypothetical protein VHE83_03430 [Mycobacteriales bacterium]|nr:hypothetical protein [Mycobacteriales bacterium]
MKRDERGSALIEAAALAPLLLIPVLYLALTLHRAEQARLAAAAGARDAARAYATAPSTDDARAWSHAAVRTAFADQGMPGARLDITFAREPGATCDRSSVTAPVLTPGDAVLVCVRATVALPFADRGIVRGAFPAGLPVSAQAVAVVDDHRGDPP